MSTNQVTARNHQWRVIIADDEPLARTRLRGLLQRHETFTVVQECTNGLAVLAALDSIAADVLFLDIRMPQLDGVAVAEALLQYRESDHTQTREFPHGRQQVPAIVFVTAHDIQAQRAFELEAVAYLVKPVDIDKFDRAMHRVVQYLHERRSHSDAARAHAVANAPNAAIAHAVAMVSDARSSPDVRTIPAEYAERFAVRDSKGIYFVASRDVERIEAEGNYVALISAGRRHLVRETMRRIQTKLDPSVFVRVHRSAIVRIDCIRRLEPWGHGEYLLTLTDNTRMTSSRSCSDALRRLLR